MTTLFWFNIVNNLCRLPDVPSFLGIHVKSSTLGPQRFDPHIWKNPLHVLQKTLLLRPGTQQTCKSGTWLNCTSNIGEPGSRLEIRRRFKFRVKYRIEYRGEYQILGKFLSIKVWLKTRIPRVDSTRLDYYSPYSSKIQVFATWTRVE